MNSDRLSNETLKYISDWQKRAKKQQLRYNIVLVTSLIIAFIVCTIFTMWFRQENYKRVVELNKKYVQDSAIQEADQIEQRLTECQDQIKKYAKQYNILLKNENYVTVEERLNVLCDRTLFDRVSFISTDGYDVTVQGSCSVTDRDYFQKAMDGETGYEFVSASYITGEPVLIFYSPIRKYPDNENSEIIGIMTGIYEYERVDKLLNYKFFNFEPDTYLVRRNGNIIANSQNKDIAKNMFERLADKEYLDEVDYAEIMNTLQDEGKNSVAFKFKEEGKTSLGVVAQLSDQNWFVVSVLSYDILDPMIDRANRAGNIMSFSIIGVLALMIVVCMFFLMKRYNSLEKDMAITTESLEKTNIHDLMQTFIVGSLVNTYSSVYYADIANQSYRRIKEEQASSMVFPDKGHLDAIFHGYIGKFVDEQYRERMIKFLDFDSFSSRLGENEYISVEYQRADKLWRKALLLPAKYDEQGNIISAIFAVQRIDTEKQRELETQVALQEAFEAAQMASAAKTTFLSNMSHDIRTPMNAIVGMTVIAGSNLDNREKVSDCLKKIAGASKHLLGLINEVLDMSKIESGKVDLNDEEFSLSNLLDELISMNQSLIKEKDHALTVRVNRLVHENVVGDSTRLQQVFNNLLTNAIKYTPNGGKLEIIVSEKETNKPTIGWYEVKFKDNGIGMSEDFQKRIFDPFSRADDNRISNIQGTGLGMAIARNIVRMMNGDLTVESEINKGSTFTVSFSLKLQNETEVNYAEFIDLPVLVVDDDVSACESTCAMLDSLSMASEWVDNGAEAVAKTVERHEKNDDYYAVIVDWKMPDMDGIETTKAIRKQVGNDVPIVVLTAYDWSDIEQDAREAGVNAFLSKPLFKLRLVDMFADLKHAEKPIDPKAKELTEQDFTGKRILLAEDNELNREIAVEILSMMGLEIETAENGKIAHEMFSASKPGYYDMVLMDIQMPVMNGYEATRAIRATHHADAKRIPIVAMTANAFSTDVRAAFDSGMNGHIPKPIEMGNVINALKENLK